ncbi:MAG: GAF domain-containing sensor histidine kinase [Nitrospina sp.]|nr:GAF domain-containing sensor histidine kinase [Nitrospina sp.]MBT6346053.1 GAF domain-containing sensor histidine kinase [Nitrospina sp.]
MEQENKPSRAFPLKYVAVGLATSGLIFLIDIQVSLGFAGGMLYVILVLLGLMAKNRPLIIYAAILGSLLNALGFLASPPGGEWSIVLANRVLAVFTIWMTTLLCLVIFRTESSLRSANDKLEEKIKDRVEEFKETNERLNTEIEYSKLIKTIAVASNETRAIDDTLAFCLRQVGEFAGWPLGHLYLKAETPSDGLVPTNVWHVEKTGQFDTFQKITQATPLEEGVGLPGRVLISGEPAWIIDVTKDSNFPRAKLAENIGVKAGFAFPIMIGKKVMGVMEFFSPKAVEPDPEMLDIMAQIGTQLGRVLERKQAHDESERSHEQLRNLYHRLEQVREEERTRTAREVHDHLSQMLTTIKLELSLLGKKLAHYNPSIQKSTEHLLEMSDGAIQSVKKISMDLRPPILDDLGIAEAITWQAKDFKVRTGIECKFVDELDDFEPDLERSTTLFRIFQETLTNIVRHADATKVCVTLSENNDSITLCVQDNGCGISSHQVSSLRSLGLLGMRERAMVWGGNVLIRGVPEGGTTVTIKIQKG